MTIEMTRRLMNGIALVDLRGPLTAGVAADNGSLRTAVAELAEAGYAEIAVKLDAVTRLDAGGLGELVLTLHAGRDRGRRLTLVAPPPRVQRMLSITRLDTVFELCETEAELHARRGAVGLTPRTAVGDAQAAYA